jgi:hypothetical protein
MSHTDHAQQAQSSGTMSDELIALLRYRVTTRYYDQPQVMDAVARIIAGARAYVITSP